MSSRTHTDKDAKTGWVPSLSSKLKNVKLSNNITLVVTVIILLLLVVKLSTSATKRMIINNHKFYAMVVSTPEAREKGLSGKDKLGRNQAMLFEYPGINASCIWMKDMKFAIDIIWLDGNKRVVTTKSNATPDSYPETFCASSNNAQYVLEVPKGTVTSAGIKIGDQAKF